MIDRFNDRFNDINKQGFMRSVYRKRKKQVEYEVWTNEGVVSVTKDKIQAGLLASRHSGVVKKVTR